MPDTDQNQNLNEAQDEQYQLTGDDLAELHGLASQMDSAGDPRAGKLWDFIGSQSSGDGDAVRTMEYRFDPSQAQTTSWLDDLEQELSANSARGSAFPVTNIRDGNPSLSATEQDAVTPTSAPTAQRSEQARQSVQGDAGPTKQATPTGSQSQAQQQKPQQPTATIVVTYDKELGFKLGSHSGLYLTGTPDGEILYDPAGSYRQGRRGSGALFTKDDDNVSLDDYVKFHKSTGSEVKTYTFPLSPAEAKQIYERAENLGDPNGPQCATYVSKAISGIGPFTSVGNTFWPGNLASEMEKIKSGMGNDKNPRGGGGGGGGW